jgi:xanthine/uracil permease
LTGTWQSTVIVWAMFIGTGVYAVLFPDAVISAQSLRTPPAIEALTKWHFTFSFQPTVLISFLVCFLAVSINDLSSIQSMNRLLNLQDMDRRVSRGVTITGLANVLAGLMGVVGPVNYSLSPGVVMTTRCASRFTLLPTAAMIGILPFFPTAMQWVSMIPSVVIGCILLYVLASQVVAGLSVAFPEGRTASVSIQNGSVIGLPLLLGTMTAFLPDDVLASFPAIWRPILGNGFVVGIVVALLLEHVRVQLPNESHSKAP